MLERLRRRPLLRSGPLLLLPSGVDARQVDELVAAWAPSRRQRGDHVDLVDGLRWIGPVAVSLEDAAEHDLPSGYRIAYVAQARMRRVTPDEKPSRASRLLDRVLLLPDIETEIEQELERQVEQEIAEGSTTREEYEAATAAALDREAREYPHGIPIGAEGDGWHLVCGLARRLRGVCRLPDGEFLLPWLEGPPDGWTMFGRLRPDAETVLAALEPVLGPLVLDDGLDQASVADGDWELVRGQGKDRVGVTLLSGLADTVGADDRFAGVPPLAAIDPAGGRPHEYLVSGVDADTARRAYALLAPLVDGLLVDEEGFPVPVA